MIVARRMIGAAAAAVLVLAMSPVAWAQQGFNGSVIGNVYRNPASGCGYGFGYLGPGCPYGGYVCSAPGHCYYRAGPGNGSGDHDNEAPRPWREGHARRPSANPCQGWC
jgi:hypothetical protein